MSAGSSEQVLKVPPASADSQRMDGDPALQRLYDHYRVVVAAHRAQKRTSSLRAAEAVIEARVMLFEHLVRTGWDPPEEVRRQLALDALLIEQPPSALTG